MKRLLVGLVATALAGFAAAQADAAEYVYVESNIQQTNGNSILAFKRRDDGSLSSIGAPFPTGGTGVQDTTFIFGPYDSDTNIVTDARRRLLFAVNSGSDSIAVFRINKDGTLRAIPGSPFPSGGVNPVSLSIVGNTLFVANQNGDLGRLRTQLPNYTALRIAADGSLSPLKDSPSTLLGGKAKIDVAWGSSPSVVYPVPGTNLLFGADFRAGLLQSFRFDVTGRMRQNPPVALPVNPAIPDFVAQDLRLGNFPLGIISHPKENLLYVGFVVTNELGVYSYNPLGNLSFVKTVPNAGIAICWLRTNKSGTRLYTSNNGVSGLNLPNDVFSTVSVYDLSDPETPREIQTLQLAGMGNSVQLELSSDEKNLYVVSQRAIGTIPAGVGNALHNFSIRRDGTLVENHAPINLKVPVGTQPQGIGVFTDD